ncbi:MAG: metalloregulator ArsR/SmtB family transcription factor [Pseudomonadota bacterium]
MLRAPPQASLDNTVALMRAAGEPTRMRVLALLSASDLTVKDLTAILGQSQPRISRHLKLLADAALVTRSTEGAFAYYRLAEGADGRRPADDLLALLDRHDPTLTRDEARRSAIRRANAEAAADYFARNAPLWDKIGSLHAPDEAVEAVILDAFGPHGAQNLLDIGTGTGRMLRLLSPHAKRLLGVDSSASMLSVARANLDAAGIRNARLAQEDIHALSLPTDGFDAITIHQVLHFLDDPARAIAEAARTLAPGGRLIVVDFAPHTLEALRLEAHHRRLGISPAEMDGWLTAAGLHSEATKNVNGGADTLTVTVWLARDPRLVTDDIRLPEGAFA